MIFPLSCNYNNYMTYNWPNSAFFNFQKNANQENCRHSSCILFFYWQIGTKNLTRREFIVEPSFFTSWTIRSEKYALAHVQQNKTVYLSIYLSIWKPFWKRVCIYIYIYIIADQDRARYSVCSAQEKCVSLAERCTTDSKISFTSVQVIF